MILSYLTHPMCSLYYTQGKYERLFSFSKRNVYPCSTAIGKIYIYIHVYIDI